MISIIGAGKVGSSAAFNILRFRISDVVLIDIFEDLAYGEGLDMMHATPAIKFLRQTPLPKDYILFY